MLYLIKLVGVSVLNQPFELYVWMNDNSFFGTAEEVKYANSFTAEEVAEYLPMFMRRWPGNDEGHRYSFHIVPAPQE